MFLHRLVFSSRPLPRVTRHLFFCLSFIIYRVVEFMPAAEWYRNNKELFYAFQNALVHLPVVMLVVYLGVYFILPRYLASARYGAAVLSCLILFLGAFAINYFAETLLSQLFFPVPLTPGEHFRNTETSTIALMVPFFATAIAFKMTKDHIVRQKETQQLLNEKLKSGYRLMKARLQPVILLDALSDIYADISGGYLHAPAMILRLSDLLHYILYETDTQRVSINKEVQMMEDYVNLKSVRNNKSTMTEFVVSGNPYGKTIPPLLCLPLIDMLFRRETMPESISRISIAWWFQGDRSSLSLTCMQNREQPVLSGMEEAILQATRSSLEINYPGSFVFEVDEREERLDIFMEISTAYSAYA